MYNLVVFVVGKTVENPTFLWSKQNKNSSGSSNIKQLDETTAFEKPNITVAETHTHPNIINEENANSCQKDNITGPVNGKEIEQSNSQILPTEASELSKECDKKDASSLMNICDPDKTDEASLLNASEEEISKSMVTTNDDDKETTKDLFTCKRDNVEEKIEDQSESLTLNTEDIYLHVESDNMNNVTAFANLSGLDNKNGKILQHNLNGETSKSSIEKVEDWTSMKDLNSSQKDDSTVPVENKEEKQSESLNLKTKDYKLMFEFGEEAVGLMNNLTGWIKNEADQNEQSEKKEWHFAASFLDTIFCIAFSLAFGITYVVFKFG